MVLTLVSLFTFASVEAGSDTRHRWQGAAIALGVVAGLGLLVHGLHTLPPAPAPNASYLPPQGRYGPPPREYAPGNWETTREWIPGTRVRVWIPGHYDRWGNWVSGHYVDRQTPGRYVERRVWMEGDDRPY